MPAEQVPELSPTALAGMSQTADATDHDGPTTQTTAASWSRPGRLLGRGLEHFGVVLGVVLVGLILFIVGGRFLGIAVPAGVPEAATFIFIWWVLAGATVGVAHNSHPRITFLVDRLPQSAQGAARLASDLATLAYFGLLSAFGIRLMVAAPQHDEALPIPMALPYAALGVGAAAMFLLHLTVVLRDRRPDLASLAAVPGLALLALVDIECWRLSPYAFIVLSAALLLLLSVPVASALGLTTLTTLLMTGPTGLAVNYPIRLFDGLDNYVLIAIPLFILMGSVMSNGGIARRMVGLVAPLVGRVRGGLGLGNLGASALMADMSGSAVSDTAVIGGVMLPELTRRGYDRRFATALQASAGTLGMLFPPSTTMILYAWVSGESVARLFMASFIPGILVTVSFAIVIYITARRRNYPREQRATLAKTVRAGGRALPALGAPVLILAGIFSGLFTATEASAIGVVYVLLVSFFAYRDLHVRDLPRVINEASTSMSRVVFVAGNAIAFSWVLIIHQGPQRLAVSLPGITSSAVLVVALIIVLLLVLHTVLEGASTVVAIVPVLLPVLAAFHVDLVVFGVLVMLSAAVGLITPPVGLCLFVSSAISGEKIESASRAALPFAFALVVDIVIVLLFPQLVLVLPDLVYG